MIMVLGPHEEEGRGPRRARGRPRPPGPGARDETSASAGAAAEDPSADPRSPRQRTPAPETEPAPTAADREQPVADRTTHAPAPAGTDRTTDGTTEGDTGAMPKMKTHSGTKKRVRVTGTGKVMREQANRRHLLEGKSSKRTRAPQHATSRCRQRRRQEGQAPARQVADDPATTKE